MAPFGATAQQVSSVLPAPSYGLVQPGAMPFVLRSPVHIVVAKGSRRLAEIGEMLADVIRRRTGFVVSVGSGANRQAIVLDANLGGADSEAYVLGVSAGGVFIHGASAAGTLWGVQTLRQLLPVAFDDLNGSRPASWEIAPAAIRDAPRFPWRGSMVDAGRHFFPVSVIKRHIDLLSRFKMNVFHWHLTEDQGWRVEIKRYPKLTSVGAWRTESDGTRYGGFYTQQQIRDVVEFARRRGVTVVPEIEMPGHSLAALASYPQLGCTGEQLKVATTWGVFSDVYCPGKESTFTFVEHVLDEVMALFPSKYIHIGGDEVPKDRWKACASCQAVMRREGIANEDELQNWFVGRIAKYLEAHGRRLVGWNEILHGGHLIASATVQSWQDSSWTRRAVNEGHDVIASPGAFTYLNRPASELTLDHVYAFEPVPPGLDSTARQHVLGGEVPLWSEHIPSGANLDLMAYPRLLAFAEVMWSSGARDTASFHRRLESDLLPRLHAMGVAVGPADRELMRLSVTYDSIAHAPRIRTIAGAPGVVLRGSTNGRAPTAFSPIVADSTLITGEGARRFQPFYGNEPILNERVVAIERHHGLGARVGLATQPDRRYPGTGAGSLSDGLHGGTDHADGLWQGWLGHDVDATLTLDSMQVVTTIRIAFLQNIRSWITLPKQVEFSWSSDSLRWNPATVQGHNIPVQREGAIVQSFTATLPPGTRVRFIRVIGRNAGVLPAGHPGAGGPSWLFADEVVVW